MGRYDDERAARDEWLEQQARERADAIEAEYQAAACHRQVWTNPDTGECEHADHHAATAS